MNPKEYIENLGFKVELVSPDQDLKYSQDVVSYNPKLKIIEVINLDSEIAQHFLSHELAHIYWVSKKRLKLNNFGYEFRKDGKFDKFESKVYLIQTKISEYFNLPKAEMVQKNVYKNMINANLNQDEIDKINLIKIEDILKIIQAKLGE